MSQSVIPYALLRRRNQLISFLVFFTLFAILLASLVSNPWYQIPVDWYFIPVLGLVGAIMVPAFFGRHYCGQYCPTGFVADSFPHRNRAGKLLKSRQLRKLFVTLFVAIFVVALLPWEMGLPASMTATYWQAAMNKLWILWLVCPFAIAFPLILTLGATKGGRTWCNYLCPWGAIGVALGKPQLQVTDRCDGCGECLKACSQPEVLVEAVNRRGGAVDKNCLFCLKCADACAVDGAIQKAN